MGRKNGAFAAGLADGIMSIPWMHLIFMFLLYIFLNTDVFVESVLGRLRGTVIDGVPTTWGVVVTGMLFVALMLIIDLAIEKGLFSFREKPESAESEPKKSKKSKKSPKVGKAKSRGTDKPSRSGMSKNEMADSYMLPGHREVVTGPAGLEDQLVEASAELPNYDYRMG